MTKIALLIAALGLGACTDPAGTGSDGFSGDWVARPYRWNVTCSNPGGTMTGGSNAETDGLSRYHLDVVGTGVQMHVTDQDVGCVQLFSLAGGRATHTGDDGPCDFHVDGVDGSGDRTTTSDVLVLAADGASFEETSTYTVTYPGNYVCHGNDGGTWVRE